MLKIGFNSELLEQQISRLPKGCVLEMSEETLMVLRQLYASNYQRYNDFDFGEFIGYRIKTYKGNGHISMVISPVMPLEQIQIQTVVNLKKETENV